MLSFFPNKNFLLLYKIFNMLLHESFENKVLIYAVVEQWNEWCGFPKCQFNKNLKLLILTKSLAVAAKCFYHFHKFWNNSQVHECTLV